MEIKTACVSDIGSARNVNQDAIVLKTLKKHGQMLVVGAVFDGIGGLERGELASGLLAEELMQWIEFLSERIDLRKAEPDILFAHFRDEADWLNETLYAFNMQYQIQTGSTMSAILILKGQYYVIQVGDSRVYRFHKYLEQLTDDEISSEKKNGRIRKKLTNFMGKKEKLQFKAYQGNVYPGDSFLFCSDGFYHHLLASDIAGLFRENLKESELRSELTYLVGQMIARGEHDNISAGIISCNYRQRKGWLKQSGISDRERPKEEIG